LEPLFSESILSVKTCHRCGTSILENASYCGNCGFSISASEQTDASGFQRNNIVEKTLWQWFSPAIGLWVVLLVIAGVFGFLIHILNFSSPYFELGEQLLSIIVILIPCFKARNQLKPLLSTFSHRGVFSCTEIIGSLIFLYFFVWLYIKVVALIGVQKLSYLLYYKEHGWPFWSVFILICLMPGIFEELAFRGYIMSRLEKAGNVREALIIQAAMFSILHLLPGVFITHFIFGLILGAVRLRSGSLYPGMLIHIAWNGIVIIEEAYELGVWNC
jgi:uncharacterized protein